MAELNEIIKPCLVLPFPLLSIPLTSNMGQKACVSSLLQPTSPFCTTISYLSACLSRTWVVDIFQSCLLIENCTFLRNYFSRSAQILWGIHCSKRKHTQSHPYMWKIRFLHFFSWMWATYFPLDIMLWWITAMMLQFWRSLLCFIGQTLF